MKHITTNMDKEFGKEIISLNDWADVKEPIQLLEIRTHGKKSAFEKTLFWKGTITGTVYNQRVKRSPRRIILKSEV